MTEHKLLMLIFDFGKVVGLDSSAATAMMGIWRLLRDKNVQYRIVGLSPAVIQTFRESGGFEKEVVVLTDIDEALEQGEEIVLSHHASESSAHPSFSEWLSSLLGDKKSAALLQQHLVEAHYKVGDYLCRQGEATDDLFLIEAGRLTAIIANDTGTQMRVRAFGANTIIGEIAFVLNVPRTASLQVDDDAIVWSLGRGAYRDLIATNPNIILELTQSILRLQVERLSFATRRIADLQS